MSEPESLFCSVTETAQLLGLSETTVRVMIAKQQIPSRKFGRRRVVARRWIEQQADQYSDDQPPSVLRLRRKA